MSSELKRSILEGKESSGDSRANKTYKAGEGQKGRTPTTLRQLERRTLQIGQGHPKIKLLWVITSHPGVDFSAMQLPESSVFLHGAVKLLSSANFT